MDPFPWKLMVSVPDEVESEEHWKSIETFVEMHFVNTLDWNFGSQVRKRCAYFNMINQMLFNSLKHSCILIVFNFFFCTEGSIVLPKWFAQIF